jgi:benzoyl-CoA 2,3-dioxygenase component B
VGQWLPTDADRAQVASLMVPHYEPGDFAGWIAPPKTGINDQPVEFDYVHLREEALA